MANHVMFRSDSLGGTTLGKYLASVRITEDIDNGMLVVPGAYESGSREVRTYTTPAKDTPRSKLAILGSEEVDKAASYDTVGGFTNKKGSPARAYFLDDMGCFAVTAGAFDVVPAVGKIIEAQDSNKMKVVDTLTSGSTKIGECVEVQVDGATTWYVIRIEG